MNPFQYVNLTDPTFCCLLERSAQIANAAEPLPDLNRPESAIVNRLCDFAPYLVPNVARIAETALEGVYTLYFEGNVTRTPLTAIDTSGQLKTVGTYMPCARGWAVNVRLVVR